MSLTAPTSFLGGPHTILPRPIESLLSWSLALSCLSVSGYHYMVNTHIKSYVCYALHQIRSWRRAILGSNVMVDEPSFPCWLPLMTASREEQSRATPEERLDQALVLLERKQLNDLAISDDELVVRIRSNEILRRLVSLAMRPDDGRNGSKNDKNPTKMYQKRTALRRQLIRIWPQLLCLPTPPPDTAAAWDISLIVPCYQELLSDIEHKLTHALQHCAHPPRVQVILVWATRSVTPDHPDWTWLRDTAPWGNVQILTFDQESGRGPCLNYGARAATGSILAFCHSDTKLPWQWDVSLRHALDADTTTVPTARANACAFGFGIDTDGIMPPGIQAVATTANWRCRLWSLPYGDQCLALRATDFDYLGGFPHQCFMEDYELIALLRQRMRLLTRFPWHGRARDERLRIIPGPPALCSPRRWQRYGVLYVTYTNSKLVNLYAGGTTPDELYRLYYGQELPVVAPKSPWEHELETIMNCDTTSARPAV